MKTLIVPTALAATAFAQSGFLPSPGTTFLCNTTSENIISPSFLAIASTTINNACAALMPPCAYPNRQPGDTICIQTVDFPLASQKSTTQSLVDFQNLLGQKVNGLGLKFTVVPAANPIATAGVFWSKYDCYGYFATILGRFAPNGCRTTSGFGIGSLTVGDQDQASLSYSVFDVSIVPLAISPVSSLTVPSAPSALAGSLPAVPAVSVPAVPKE